MNHGGAAAAHLPGAPEHYGSAPLSRSIVKNRRPTRLNFAAICLCLFVPWFLFIITYAVMSFSIHYKNKPVCYLVVLLCLAFVGIIAKLAWDAVKRFKKDSLADPSWFIFLAVACFLAWLAGVALGDMNFFYNMEPFYDVSNLNSYHSVNPDNMPGQRVMDAGRIDFTPGSKLDLEKTMAFHNLETYCVAPIVTGDKSKPDSYDFWAVGLNCCSGAPGSFACGEFNNPRASSGLRVMRDDQGSFYRLAVQQAEAAYNIRAKHPLFLFWMQDPVAEVAAYMDEGFKYYLLGVFAFFAFLLFLVILAMIILSKVA